MRQPLPRVPLSSWRGRTPATMRPLIEIVAQIRETEHLKKDLSDEDAARII
jgi:hypothetical protein